MKYTRYFNKTFQDNLRDFTSLGNPLILLIMAFFIIGNTITLIYLIIGLLFIEIFGSLIKIFYYKNRPSRESYKNILEKIDSGSFPSLHSARACFIFISLFVLTNNIVFKILLISLIFIVLLTRILLKKHYIKDTIAGIILGIITFFIGRIIGWF